MSIVAVDLSKAFRLLNHGPVTIVSSAHAGRRNAMAAAWTMPLDFSPPKVCAVIDRNTLTRELVEAAGCFALNIPCQAQAGTTLDVGSLAGRDVPGGDKLAHLGLASRPASRIEAPLLEGCAGWLECRIIPEPHNQQTYDLFIGEVIAAWADAAVFGDGRWHFDEAPADRRTLHYVAGGSFFVTGEALTLERAED